MSARPFFMPNPAPTAATIGAVAALVAAAFLALRYAEPAPLPLAAGFALIVLGIAIRLVTNATLRKNEEVCRDGLYAVCRHPMYVGTITAAAGIAVALNHPAALALLVVAVAISLHRIRKEEDFLKNKFPDYEEYARAVPAFPTPGSVARAFAGGRLRQRLSLSRCFLNGEVLRLNLYLAMLLAAGFYLQVSSWVTGIGAMLAVVLAFFSVRAHPAESPRSRFDYLLPGVLSAAILVLVFR